MTAPRICTSRGSFGAASGRSPVLPTRTSNRRPTRRPSSRRSTAPLGLNASQIATNLNVSLSSSEQVTPNFWTDPAKGIPYYLAVQTPEPQIASLNSLTNTPVSTALSPQGDHELPAGRQDRVAHRDPQRACCVVGGIDEHLGRCRLLLQSLARLSDQPRVLHRDYRLRGEVLQQGDLLVGERPHLLTVDADRAEQRILLAQRHGDQRTHTAGAVRHARRSAPASPPAGSPYPPEAHRASSSQPGFDHNPARVAPSFGTPIQFVAVLHGEMLAIVKPDPVCRRLMTVPGVGALVAITFKSAVDDPGRFARSRVLGALAARSGGLGYRILIPPYGGSNPPAPANQSGCLRVLRSRR